MLLVLEITVQEITGTSTLKLKQNRSEMTVLQCGETHDCSPGDQHIVSATDTLDKMIVRFVIFVLLC